jgi:transcriptional regulator GlxA family with amidase domain
MPIRVRLTEPIPSVVRGVVDDPAGDHSLETMAAKAVVSVRHLNRLVAQPAYRDRSRPTAEER